MQGVQGGTGGMQGGADDIETAKATYMRGKELEDPQAKVRLPCSRSAHTFGFGF